MRILIVIAILFLLSGALIADSTRVNIIASADDACDRGGTFSTSSVDLYMGKDNDGRLCNAGQRYQDVDVAQGSTIDSAFIYVRSLSTLSTAALGKVFCEDTASAATFSDLTDFNNRIKTTDSVIWNPAAWTSETWYKSPDIKVPIQEVIDRADWELNNDMVILLLNNGSVNWQDYRVWSSYDHAAAYASYLVIFYTEGQDITHDVVCYDTAAEDLSFYDDYTGDIDSLMFVIDDDDNIADPLATYMINSPTDPDSATFSELDNNTQYWCWAMAYYDEGNSKVSDPVIVTTYYKVEHSFTHVESTMTTFTIENDYTANTVTRLTMFWSSYENFDPVIDSAVVTEGITDPDTLEATGLDADKILYFKWIIVDELGADTSAIDSIHTPVEDSPPDDYTFFDIIAVLSINPDSILISVGMIDSLDYDTTEIRYSTVSYASLIDRTSGTRLMATGVWKNSDTTLILTVAEPTWVYVKAFVGDEIPNFSAGVGDSIYVPAGGAGKVSRNIMFDYILNNQVKK